MLRSTDWNLLPRWQVGLLQLPPLGNEAGAAEQWEPTSSVRRAGSPWCEVAARGIDAGSVALSMGRSLEVHLRSYPWSSQITAAQAFARAAAAGPVERRPQLT